MPLNIGWSEGLAVVLGGLLTHLLGPLITTLLKKPAEEFNQAVQIRDELRLQIANMQEQIDSTFDEVNILRQKVNEWQDKYYDLLQRNIELQAKYNEVIEELSEMRRKYGEDV